MRPPALAVALAALCVLAGCNTFAPGQSSAQGTAPPVTPADVPQDLSGGTIAPGLTEQGIVDAEALYESHQRQVANQSLTLQFSYEERRNETTTQSAVVTYRYGPNRTTSVTETAFTDGGPLAYDRSSSWSNRTTSYTRMVIGDTTTYDRTTLNAEQREGRVSTYEYRTDGIGRILDTLVVEDVTYMGSDDGVALYSVGGSLPQQGQQCTASSEVSVDASARVVVDEHGLVRGYEQTTPRCTYLDERVNGTATEELVFEDVGTTDVSAPDWVADARESIADREYVAPGVTTERVVAPNDLSVAHRELVEGEPVRFSEEHGTVVDGELAPDTTRQIIVGSDGGVLVDSVQHDDPASEYSSWTNGTIGYVRETRGGETQFLRRDEVRANVGHRLDLNYLLTYAEETSVTPLDDGRYRVTARELPTVYYTAASADVPERAGYVSFVVDERGFVSEFERELLDVDRETGQQVRRYYTVSYADLGEATVERPDWVAEAIDQTSRAGNPTESDDE